MARRDLLFGLTLPPVVADLIRLRYGVSLYEGSESDGRELAFSA